MAGTIETFHRTTKPIEDPTAVFCGPLRHIAEWRRSLPEGWIIKSQKRFVTLIPTGKHQTSEPGVWEEKLADYIFEVVVWPSRRPDEETL